MGRRRDVRNEERWTIVMLRQAGMMVSRIATRMQISVHTVSRDWRLFQETGETTKRERPGRRRKTTARNDRILKRLSTENKFQSVATINHLWNERTGMRTLIKTTRRRLHAMGYYNQHTNADYLGTNNVPTICVVEHPINM